MTQVHESQIPDKELDKKAYKLVKKVGSLRKAAKSDETDLGKSALGKRKKRYASYLNGDYKYPTL